MTRSIIASAFDDNTPACSFWVYTEGCCTYNFTIAFNYFVNII